MFVPAGSSSVVAASNLSDELRRFRSVTSLLMFSESLELGEGEVQFGIFVGDAIEILRGLLKVFHGVGGFGRHRFDHFQHLRRGFTQIGSALSGEYLAILCTTGGF